MGRRKIKVKPIMEKIYSSIDSDVLLHIVHSADDFVQSRNDIVPATQFIQLACLKMPKGKTFRPHKHIWKPVQHDESIAQESWVVVKGSVRCYFYDTDDTLLVTKILNPGDCSITLQGGHNYEILEENTLVYEYKTGPYLGQENDKEFLND